MEQWWLDILGAEKVWARHTRGAGVVVAVIDDGVHPGGDLEGAVLPGFKHPGSGRGDVGHDRVFHGTTMATVIAGRGAGPEIMGMAPEATILPVNIPKGISTDHTVSALRTLAAMDERDGVRSVQWGFGAVRPRHAIEDEVPADAPNPV
ncbi:S8 family serine peptidase [Nocardioides sp. cx-169]|uniref:S8 family serine peptidase n=1 Tax=Nocardioides sp. cx-169 TaxID=2899080 RepID=UPI001E4A6BE3|nr:S8 family serine peptidase [Nocardioides sp. cx-169]MCD4535458.1 S8 family serine peptidase [Nocardioides sp. cx-169]